MIKRLCLKPLELMMAEIGERADIRHLLFFLRMWDVILKIETIFP
jgi:hypothetical protein